MHTMISEADSIRGITPEGMWVLLKLLTHHGSFVVST